MNIVFLGTSEFAVPALKAIQEKTDWKISLVVCEPAKPAGRYNKITDSPIALEAQKFGLEIYAPESISSPEAIKVLSKIGADIFIVTAYGQIIPRFIFDIPKFKTINIHPSLLPKLRGPSPIQAALLDNLKETGVSLMQIDEKMDRGPILSQQALLILDADNYKTLEGKLSDLGSEMMIRDLPEYINGDIAPIPQNESEATYTRLINKEDGRVNWQKSADEIYNQWRAFIKWPGIFTEIKSPLIRLKLIEIEKSTSQHHYSTGEVFLDQKNLFIACSQGAIKLIKVQPESKKILTAEEFLNGYREIIGQILL